MEHRLRQSFQCLTKWSDAPSHRTRGFAFGPTSFPNAAESLRSRATQIRIGTRPSASSFANQVNELGFLRKRREILAEFSEQKGMSCCPPRQRQKSAELNRLNKEKVC